jgi:hypothetical protein
MDKKKNSKDSKDSKDKYKDEYAKTVFKITCLGATNDKIASYLGISQETVLNWCKRHKKFNKAYKQGKQEADIDVAHALYKSAIGGYVTETKTYTDNGRKMTETKKKYIRPDVMACIFWLNKRNPAWAEVKDQANAQKPVVVLSIEDKEYIDNI